MRALLKFFGKEILDEATLWALTYKLSMIVGTVATMGAILFFLSPTEQGYYYTFISLLALQIFFDLALPGVLANIASHEWALLRLNQEGAVEGDPVALGRLGALYRSSAAWFRVTAMVFTVVVALGGGYFLCGAEWSSGYWAPWLWAVLANGLLVAVLPYNAILEGCQQVASVQKNRCFQALISMGIFCIGLACGLGLWSVGWSAFGKLVLNLWLVAVQKRYFFNSLFQAEGKAGFSWKSEVLPLQWRIALLALVNYFVFSLFTPVAFRYHGAEEAARVGMTLQIANALSSVAATWGLVKAPVFGALISQRKYRDLDRLWWRLTALCVGLNAGVLAPAYFALDALKHWSSFEARVCSGTVFMVFMAATVFMTASYSMSAYLRAHKQEPLVVMGVVMSLIQGVLVWVTGQKWGAMGMAATQLGCWAAVCVWEYFIWADCRKKWHAHPASCNQ